MKKILVLTTIALLTVGTVYGSEMIVQLKSGNSLVIKYSGSIETITMQGNSDSIIGMTMHAANNQQSPQQKASVSTGKDTVTTTATTTATVKKKEESSSSPRVKWAKPMDDENLKNARSKSRKGWFAKD